MVYVTNEIELSATPSREIVCTYVVPDSRASSNVSRFLQLQGFLDEVRDLLAHCPHRSITDAVDG